MWAALPAGEAIDGGASFGGGVGCSERLVCPYLRSDHFPMTFSSRTDVVSTRLIDSYFDCLVNTVAAGDWVHFGLQSGVPMYKKRQCGFCGWIFGKEPPTGFTVGFSLTY
jgi:hypothetical protein